MRVTHTPLVIAVVLPIWCSGQTMMFDGGQLLVESGTTITIQGDVDWHLGPDAVVVNNGVIDLGDSGTLFEPSGAAISGSGTEQALQTENGPWTAINPGGLGLLLSNSATSGAFLIHRGHVPFVAAGGDVSVARWYRIDALGNADCPVQMTFKYDEAELNGLDESSFVLHSSMDPVGNWMGLTGSTDPVGDAVSGTLQEAFAIFTVFEGDITSVSSLGPVAPALRAWPSVTDELVQVQCGNCGPASRLSIIDANGRYVMDSNIGTEPLIISVDQWSSGIYSLNISGIGSVKIIRQ